MGCLCCVWLCIRSMPGSVAYLVYFHWFPCHWKLIRYQDDLSRTSAPLVAHKPCSHKDNATCIKGMTLRPKVTKGLVCTRSVSLTNEKPMNDTWLPLMANLKESPKLASHSISRMGVLTTAQIFWGPALLPWAMPKIGTTHNLVPALIWESPNRVLSDGRGIGWWKTCRLRCVC